jgi:hypothetical protein
MKLSAISYQLSARLRNRSVRLTAEC